MPTLIMSFPGRRYHATPWGHHVNEGQIEWPPSPWRLLRALLATGYNTLDWPSDRPPDTGQGLIARLASVLPRYRLPPAVGTHSRHYMPLTRFKNGREETTLVFDTWAQVDKVELAITWDVSLNEAQTELLSDLADRLGYLGRSESWVLARPSRPDDALPDGLACLPCYETAMRGPDWEQIPLIAALPVESYMEWRQQAVAAELAKLPPLEPGKKPSKQALEQRHKAEAPYPVGLIACLRSTTDELRQHGWSQPPGSRRVFYWRRVESLEVGAPRPRTTRHNPPPVEAMLLAMATASRNDHALPHITRTLPQAERLHAQLVGHLDGRNHPVLTGCDERGYPLREAHIHAHILPLDLDGDGHLEHILIWAPKGLDPEAQTIVRALRRTFTKGGVGPLKLALVGTGPIAHIAAHLPVPAESRRRVLESIVGGSAGATTWHSLTPFVPPRYVKSHGRNSLEGQVAAEFASRNLPQPAEIRHIEPRQTEEALRMRHFIRTRRLGPKAPVDYGYGLVLRFEEPVAGPLCLGYASHFGLGMFTAVLARDVGAFGVDAWSNHP